MPKNAPEHIMMNMTMHKQSRVARRTGRLRVTDMYLNGPRSQAHMQKHDLISVDHDVYIATHAAEQGIQLSLHQEKNQSGVLGGGDTQGKYGSFKS